MKDKLKALASKRLQRGQKIRKPQHKIEQQFKNFQTKTGNDIDPLFAKLEMNAQMTRKKEKSINYERKILN